MADAADRSEKMAELQRIRMNLVLLSSQENCKLLSRRQRVAGKEIEVMCAERDLHQAEDDPDSRKALAALHAEEDILRRELRESEQDIERMEELMKKVNQDIAALCQS